MPIDDDTKLPTQIGLKLAEARARMAAAAVRYGRDIGSVTLLAVTKQQPVEIVREAIDAGQLEFGENYLQEALAKIEALAERAPTWHYLGQLQSNKTRPIAEHFAWVHTLDRIKIAERLDAQRPADLPPLNVCIQIKLAEEPGKGGIARSEVLQLARAVAPLSRLKLRGLMCIPPPRETFDEQLAFFSAAARLQNELRGQGFELDTLSMGMTGDLEAAVAAGATIVRLGTAIFGNRSYGDTRRET
jgi:pyridoxal phosphate enzyme (YggS family)